MRSKKSYSFPTRRSSDLLFAGEGADTGGPNIHANDVIVPVHREHGAVDLVRAVNGFFRSAPRGGGAMAAPAEADANFIALLASLEYRAGDHAKQELYAQPHDPFP